MRVFLANKYLDWAEKLPQFGGGIIATLESIRKSQRRWSEEAFGKSRHPQGTEIEFLYFRMVEMFHIEDFEGLKESMIQLIPALEGEYWNKDFSDDFKHYAENVFVGVQGKKLGVIVHKQKGKNFFAQPLREIAELPKEVEYISIQLHKVLPSAFFCDTRCISYGRGNTTTDAFTKQSLSSND